MREETATMKATKIVMDESNPLINQVTETVHEIYEGKTKEMFDRYKELFDAVMIHYEKSNDKNKDSVFKSAFPKNYDLMIKTVSDYHKSNERHS